MATKKDLVEAHTFSKRRLVTAFVSGAPGGREVEPVRPGRVLVGGIALSVLLLAGAAIAGFLIGRPNSQWLEEGSFVISKDTGEQYVVLHGGDDAIIQRVPNFVSAQLLLGEADLTPYTVRDKYIRQVSLGEDLGIDEAPAGLPAAADLIDDGWTACTADREGVKLSLQAGPGASELPSSAFLVSSGRTRWLVAAGSQGPDARGYRFEMPADPTQAGVIADRLGFGAIEQAPAVPEDWLNLFPLGADLTAESFGVTRGGQPAAYDDVDTDLSRFRVGDLVTTPGGSAYLLGDDGPQSLSPFAAAVYDAVGPGAQLLDDELRAAVRPPSYPQEWPETSPTAAPGPELCALLHPGTDGAEPRVLPAGDPTGDAAADGLAAGRHDVDVSPSGGAFVQSGSDDAAAEGTPFVIDAKGYKYPLIGSVVPTYIGYGDVDAPLVPNAWLSFFEPGTHLSVNLARRVPEDAPAEGTGDGES